MSRPKIGIIVERSIIYLLKRKTSYRNIYSTTKETHQALVGAIMESRIKKYKIIYSIFLNNQFCINSLNTVKVLRKSVHAV